jgi:outer membrane protein TolC
MIKRASFFIICSLHISLCTFAQGQTQSQPPPSNPARIQAPAPDARPGDTSQSLTLEQCITYALQNQPAIKQSLIGVSIARTTNAINLSGWLPQVNGTGSVTHYLQQPTSFVTNNAGQTTTQKTGVVNSVIPELTATQNIFNPQLLYAAKSAPLYIKQAQQITDSTQIDLVSNVSKAFYNLLQTLEQINVLKEDTARLNKNVSDTYHQWKSGLNDETDYDEAVISLNNSLAQLNQQNQNIVPQYATLKQLMGIPPVNQFNVSFDTTQMIGNIAFDTTEQLQFEKRVEMQQLKTAQALQQRQTDYYRLAWLPTLSAFIDYNYEFQSNSTSNLFKTAYPYSLVGLSLNIPIFTGFSRVQSVHRSRLQEQLLDWSEVNLKSQIYTDYTTSLANYKSNLYNMNMLRDNEALAKRTYNIVALQYRQGIIPYLNVITAESNLITAETGYINALFTLLSSKIDLERAMGDITAKH